MSDTRIENAIVEAIEIIADNKIANASFDKTYKAVVNKVLDKATGKYEIKYQDSLFQAYAVSSKITYQERQQVFILVPGNDWTKVKTIVGGIDNRTTNYNQIPVAGELYNSIGPNNVSELNNIIGLCSYKNNSIICNTLNEQQEDNTYALNFNTENYQYIRKGNSLALSMKVRTALDSSQVGGNYGIIFDLLFKDNIDNEKIISRSFTVSDKDVIGNPYGLVRETFVETLITNVDVQNFVGINSIIAYCEGFPTGNKQDPDIFISEIRINGAAALSEEDLSGYILHIDDSIDGNILGDKNTIKLVAQLKDRGIVVTQNVKYYWFVEDGTVFHGSDKYSGFAGDGWRCLNYFNNSTPISFSNNDFTFKATVVTQDEINNAMRIAMAQSKYTNVLCVAVYNNQWFRGQIKVINNNVGQVVIENSDKKGGQNKTIYYLDNGHPDLTCTYIPKENENIGTLTYVWSVFPARGKGQEQKSSTDVEDNYIKWTRQWETAKQNLNKVEKSKQQWYSQNNAEYINAKQNFEKVQSAPYIYENIYYNFPISQISDYSRIVCTVFEGDVYKGSGSITLYNKLQLEGMYSLNIQHGTQVFQYDKKGNSPASSQLEKPLQIVPLTFTLIDNEGKEVPYDQIVNHGYVKWIIPNSQTLLVDTGNTGGENLREDLILKNTVLPLPANDYTVYTNKQSFNYSIVDRYDSKNNINYIWLNVKFKNIILDAYTDFTFPKDGDPGTNGTDLIAKITPSLSSDRLYISNKNTSLLFNDQGDQVENLKFQLYNNSRIVENISANNWVTPPKTINKNKQDKRIGRKSYLTVSPTSGQTTKVTFSSGTTQVFSGNNGSIQTDKPVNIIRAQYGTGNGSGDLRYYAEIPICTNYIKVNQNYRIKVKPKTGFSYVVYSSDGTSPDYDNTMPFEIIVEKLIGQSYYMTGQEVYTYTFAVIGNLKNGIADGNKYIVQPEDSYNGYDLTSAIVCDINTPELDDQGKPKKDERGKVIYINIGFIHIPIYMIINRYNNRALNAWDGNSVQIDANGHGQILTPQIAAGAKDDDNTFTGVLMGQIALNTPNSTVGFNGDIGLMGYHKGARTIFLDSKTGKAQFGKQGDGKIILNPASTFTDVDGNNKPIALLYSGNYPIDEFKNNRNYNVQAVGDLYKSATREQRKDKGLLIDLSTPQIGFGNGNFTVNSEGHLIARGGGQIAGWNINDNQLHKNNKVGIASSGKTVPTNIGLKIEEDSNDTTAFWAGGTPEDSTGQKTLTNANFYVTHGGYLFSKRGQIAGWNVVEKRLYKSNVGIVSDTSDKNTNNFRVQPITGYNSSGVASGSTWQAKAFYAGVPSGSRNETPFYVTHSGYLKATSGRIGPWILSDTTIQNGNVGLGLKPISNTNMNNAFGTTFSTSNNASTPTRIWAKSSSDDKDVNFVVTNQGYLYSKKGKIGGWNIEKDKLWAGNTTAYTNGIRMNAKGTINGPNWNIDEKGNAVFNTVSGRIETSLKNGNKTQIVYLFGGDGGITNNGVPSVNAGGTSGGYYLGSNGTMSVGTAGNSMTFKDGGLTVQGTIKADAGYLGNGSTGWIIDNKGIVNKSNTVKIYPTEITYGNGNNTTKITAAKVESTRIQTKGGTDGGFWAWGSPGRTGTITFSEGTVLYIKSGLITGAKKGQDSTVVWSDRH